jgi:hypothetical protein
MVDIIDPKTTITRHMGELAAYLTQTAYSVRKYPAANRTGTASRCTTPGPIAG